MSKEFKGIWIPREILELNNIGTMDKMVLSVILGLSKNNGCTASNRYFADLFGISKTRVSIIITNLFKKSYIGYSGKVGGGIKENEKRVLNFSYTGYLTKVKPYIIDNNIDNTLEPDLPSGGMSFETKYKKFITYFNEVKGVETGTKGKFKGEPKSKRQFGNLIKSYSSTEIALAIKVMFRDKHHKENRHKWATPDLLTRPDKFEQFLAQS